MTDSPPVVHVCIATGQNAANLIPLEQLAAQEVLILQTAEMRASARHLRGALARDGRVIELVDFDDSSPEALVRSAQGLALRLDGRKVVLHVTGGTKLMVLALWQELGLVEAGTGKLDIVYADTKKQQLDWLGSIQRTEPMADVLDLRLMLRVQGYQTQGDNRHAERQKAAQPRAGLTRELGENAARHASYLGTLNWMASRAAESAEPRNLTQMLKFAPAGSFAALLEKAADRGLLQWDGDVAVTFADRSSAAYLSGGWLEEFVLLKLSGMAKPGRFSSNLQIVSADGGVPNEIDAMLVQNNRALIVECKTGEQSKAQDALYKLAQLRDRLGGSVASALYLSAKALDGEVLARAREYRVDTLAGADVAKLVAYIRNWQSS